MLKERQDVRQIEGEGFRRWFSDQYFDLIVWYEDDSPGDCLGFQLCYDKEGNERALTWTKRHGYSHTKVDDGENPFSNKMSPVLVSDGIFERDEIIGKFRKAAEASKGPGEIERGLLAFIEEKLRAYN